MTQSRLFLITRKPEAHHIASIADPWLEEEGITSVLFETEQDNGEWCYSIYVASDDVDFWRQQLTERLGSDAFGLEIQEEKLEDIDWVTHTLRDLSPVSAGRFFVHGSHDMHLANDKLVPVLIDAGQAFGTGHHGTTAGCLDMLEVVLRQSSGLLGKPRRALDIGTGSGVLAIALAKAARIPVLATDIDPIATKVANENCFINGVQEFVTCETATGFHNTAFAAFGKADLILANILARPLEALAPSLAKHVVPGGSVILSGLLPHQRSRIVAAYRLQGLVLQRWHVRDGWLTLLLKAG